MARRETTSPKSIRSKGARSSGPRTAGPADRLARETPNEKILSSNEELQSTNEELETAKEELQSANKELTTVNDELQKRNLLLAEANDDLANILSSIQIPVILIGARGEIRRFTVPAEKLLNLIPSDIGRPLADIKPQITGADPAEAARRVIETAEMTEREVRDQEGHWHLMRVRPYRTNRDRIEGAVIAFLNIDPIKRFLEQASMAQLYAEALVETVRESLVLLDRTLRVKTANSAFYRSFDLTPLQVEGKPIHELSDWEWIAVYRDRFERLLSTGERFETEVEHDFRRIGRKTLAIRGREIHIPSEVHPAILLSIDDVSERRLAERELRTLETRYRQIFESTREGIWILDAETGEILDVNPFLVEMLGFARGELVGAKPWELPVYVDPDEARARFEQLRETGYSDPSIVRMRNHRGDTIVVEKIHNVYSTGHKHVVQSNLRDVTERQRLEEELRQAQKLDSIGRLAGGLSHDFNNILNIISAYSGVLERADERKKRRAWTRSIAPCSAERRSSGSC